MNPSEIVGSSTEIFGSDLDSSFCVIVSPIYISGNPATKTISPA